VHVALVIEDDFSTRSAIAQLLMRRGYAVCEAFLPDPIPLVPSLDVIVSDVVVRPDVDSVRAWARSIQDRFGVPLVLVTAREAIAAAGPDALGVTDVIRKPFDLGDLVARIDRAVAAAPEQRAGGWNLVA
jgi:DNA-binding NtrC family response regulator